MAKKPEKPDVDAEAQQIILADALDDQSLNFALERLYAEMGGDAENRVTVYVHKLDAASGKEPRVWTGTPDDYDLTAIAKRFGSGDYRVKIYAPTERGNPGIRANQVIPMLLDPAEDQRIEAMRRGELPAGTPQVAGPVMTEEKIVALIASSVRAAIPQTPAVDPMQMLASVVGMVKQLIPAPSTATPAPDPFTMVRNVAGLMRDLRGDDLPMDRGGKVDKEGLVLAKGLDLVERMMAKADAQKPGAPALPANVQQVTHDYAGLTEEQIEEIEMMKIALRKACRSAAANEPTAEFADQYFDMIPLPMIADMYTNPEWFNIMVHAVPDCAKYRPWFEAVRAELIRIAQEEGVLTADGQLVDAVADSTTELSGDGTANAGNVAAGGTKPD
jgi:hypothetical protein